MEIRVQSLAEVSHSRREETTIFYGPLRRSLDARLATSEFPVIAKFPVFFLSLFFLSRRRLPKTDLRTARRESPLITNMYILRRTGS